MSDIRSTCKCDKVSYKSKSEATQHMKTTKYRTKVCVKAYQCRDDENVWHVSSQNQKRKEARNTNYVEYLHEKKVNKYKNYRHELDIFKPNKKNKKKRR